MAQGYKLIKRKVSDLKGGAQQERVYAIPKYAGHTDVEMLCEIISARSTVSSADVKAVLDNLNYTLTMELKAGRIVQLGEVGNFRLGLSSEGAASKEKFHNSMVKGAKVLFVPGIKLRAACRTVKFAATNSEVIVEECDRNHAV